MLDGKIQLLTLNKGEALEVLARAAQMPHKGDFRVININGTWIIYNYKAEPKGIVTEAELNKFLDYH